MQEATRTNQKLIDGDRARYAVLAGSTALATTSGYLLYLLATVFRGETCVWCLTSAALSLATFASTLRGFTVRWAVLATSFTTFVGDPERASCGSHQALYCIMGECKCGVLVLIMQMGLC